MYKLNGRVKAANKKETAVVRDRYFKCDRCSRVTLSTNREFAEENICNRCGGTLYETNPYKGPEHY